MIKKIRTRPSRFTLIYQNSSLAANLSKSLAIIPEIVLISSSIRDRGGLLGWKEDEWRKQALGIPLVPPEKRPRTKDDDEEDWEMTLNTYYASYIGDDALAS
jgi:hypothetical protein